MGERKDARALIDAIPSPTLASRLRALMPAIERRLEMGVHLQAIVNVLNESGALGAELKLATLRTYLQRYRAAQRAPARRQVSAGGAAAPAPHPYVRPAAVTPAVLREARCEEIDLHGLAELGKSTFKKKGP